MNNMREVCVGVDKIIRIDFSIEGHMSLYIHETLS